MMEKFGWTPWDIERLAEEKPGYLGQILAYMEAEARYSKDKTDPKMGEVDPENLPPEWKIKNHSKKVTASSKANQAATNAMFGI